MSTDTYIDFFSPESWELYQAKFSDENWKKDHGKSARDAWWNLISDRDTRSNHYSPSRIAYVYNLTMDENYGLWEEFTDAFSGKSLTPRLIDEIILKWEVLYRNAQNPPAHGSDNLFCRNDMVSPAGLRQILEEDGVGKVIYFRVD